MINNKLGLIFAASFITACSTSPINPIAADPIVIAKPGNSFEIMVTGLNGKRAIDVERGFHEVADDACFTKGGWSGWKMAEGTEISPVKNSSGVFTAKGLIVCSK